MKMPYDFSVHNDDGSERYFNEYIEKLVIRMHDIYTRVQEHMAESNRKYKRATIERLTCAQSRSAT